MKLVTFNIRYDCGHDGRNNFCYRKPFILKKLCQEKPDIICFQEVLPHVAVWLKEELPEYYVIGCGRSESLADEQSAIAYRKERINLMKMDTYWLSETPHVPASRYPDQSICPRICTEALFHDLETGAVFRVANTHLDHVGLEARRRGLRQILDKIEREEFFKDVPVILAGDFNADPKSVRELVMKDYPDYVNLTEGIGVTYHGFWAGHGTECIDYLFARGDIACLGVEKWTDEEDGVYLSDHYPICATLRVNHCLSRENMI